MSDFVGLFAHQETHVPRVAREASFVDHCLDHFKPMWPVARWLQSALA